MRVKEFRILSDYTQIRAAKYVRLSDPHFDLYALSKIENGRALPTPQQLSALCRLYNAYPLDLYDKEEIDLLHCMGPRLLGNRAAQDRHTLRRKFTFRGNEAVSRALQKERLELCGYESAQAWFMDCIRRLEKEYAKAEKRRKRHG